MAFKLINSAGIVMDSAAIEFTSSGTIPVGSVVVFDTVNTERVGVANTTDGNQVEIFGVSASAGTDGGQVKIIPVMYGQLWEAACTNNMRTAYISCRVALTDHATLNNVEDDATGTTGVFQILGLTGAASDKKAIGTFLKVPYGT